ncbi:MAG: AsmA-like C-terminal domain-containing protein, partial [Candidatus Scalindua sp.]
VVDHEKQQKSVELTGRDIDVNSIREVVTAFAGDNKVVKKIFQIIKGGTMPHVAFTSQGRTFDDLTKIENLVVHANMREGNVFIPGPDFDLEEVAGDVVVEKGILKGTHLEARLGDAYGQEGNLSMGLKGKDAPIHVETSITADAEQIPPLLKRLIGNETFLNQIERVVNIKGTVKGKLLLGERLDAINAEVDINEINVSVDYNGVPFPLQINDGSFHYDKENISMINLGGTFGSSSFSELTARMSLGEDARVEIQSGRVLAFLREIYPWISSFEKLDKGLKDVKTVSGILQVSSLKLQGSLSMPETFNIEATGNVNDLIVDTTLFPEPIVVKEGNIKIVENKILLSDAKVNASDISLRMWATINHTMSELVKADIGFHGEMGKESMKWIETLVKLPSALSIRPPLSIPEAHLTWEKDSGISFVSNLALQDGPGISLDMLLNSEGLEINNLLIQDAESNASFTFGLKEEEIDVGFTGNLSHTTTDKIFLNTPLSKEWIKGDFQEHIRLDHLEQSTFQGILEGGNLSIPWIQPIPLNIKNISLRADKKSVRVDSLILTWGDNHLSVNGDVNISENGFLFDLDMSAEELNWDTIRKTLGIGDKEQEKSAGEGEQFWDFPVKGILRLDAECFTFDQYTLNPVQAYISLDPDCISVEVTDANLCGISCPGVLEVTPQDISLDFQLFSHNQKLGTQIKCFGSTESLITGNIDFDAQVMAQGAIEELGRSLNGNFEITAKDGHYKGFGLLSKILTFLNPSQTLRGKLPGSTKKGLPYKSFTANGQIQNGILAIEEYALDAPSMGVTGQGTIDLFEKKVDIQVLVSPFNTADLVIRKIPIVRGILGGTLVSIPIQVKGDMEDPKISYLSPMAVGKRLLNTTKRILKTPVNIIKRKKNDKNSVK